MRALSVCLSLAALAALAGVTLPAAAAVKTATVEYLDGDQTCEGFLAWDDAVKGKRPGVVVVHEWMGLGDYAKERARQLAALGYVALAADIYGKGIRAKDAAEAGRLAGRFKGDLPLLRSRARAALDTLAKDPRTDASRLFAIGYCFGGTTALELARSGAPVAGVVSFHGGLATKDPADAKNVQGRVLVLHGAADPYVPPAEVAAFQKEMDDAKVDWQMVFYAGAVHSFTNPAAGNDSSKGAAYDARADRRSWEAMKAFLAEGAK
ncbi:MAG TPA: dienelactone hydrolase family protein [Thermoanaerobaculia bacterium]|nr:dienelactone hydrolase family protein [Thermoanaerobaculia bacterium]